MNSPDVFRVQSWMHTRWVETHEPVPGEIQLRGDNGARAIYTDCAVCGEVLVPARFEAVPVTREYGVQHPCGEVIEETFNDRFSAKSLAGKLSGLSETFTVVERDVTPWRDASTPSAPSGGCGDGCRGCAACWSDSSASTDQGGA